MASSKKVTAGDLRTWMDTDAKMTASKHPQSEQGCNENNNEKSMRESIIRRTTVAYGIVELLKRSTKLKDEEIKIDNFVVFVRNKVRSSRPWDDVKGVGMKSSGMSLMLEEPSYLSALNEEGSDDRIVGRCLEVEVIKSPESKDKEGGNEGKMPTETTETANNGVLNSSYFAGINALAEVAEENNRCHLFARLLYELFTNQSFPDDAIKSATSTEEPPKKKGRIPFLLPTRTQLFLTHVQRDFQIPFQTPCIVSMQKLGIPSSICLMTQNLLESALRGNGCSSDDAYGSLGVVGEDLHLLLLDPDRFLFDNDEQRVDNIKLRYRSGKLYGREKEETLITDAFCRVSRGKSEAFFIGGFSGSGKSMLVNTLRGTVHYVGGYTIKHKFDAMSQEEPLSGVISAFNQLCLMIKIGDRPAIAEKLKGEFGVDFRLLTRILPNVKHLFGFEFVSSEIEVGDAAKMNARSVCFTLVRFMRVVSSLRHPIMLFLDDLQWADSTALDVIHAILSDRFGSCMFFVGTYRSNEVQVYHDVFDLMEKLEISNVPMTKITLEGLKHEDLNTMISDALCLYPRISKSLSWIVHQKTKGNPFFVLEFMQSLKSRGFLQYNSHQKRWMWDENITRGVDITNNVLHLLATKMNGLSGKVQTLLKVMSCFGTSTHEKVIGYLSESAEYSWIRDGLEGALHDGFIEQDEGGRFKFAHDKVREAAYNLIPDSCKKQFHYELGKLLYSVSDGKDLGDTVFSIASQLNHGKEWILKDKDLSIAIAELNMKAGKNAIDGCDHKSAYSYLGAGLSLLPEGHWENHYDLSLRLNFLMASAANSCCKHEESEVVLQQILAKARCLDDQLSPYLLLSRIYQARGKPKACFDVCASVLRELGESIPESFTHTQVSARIRETLEEYEKDGDNWLKGENVDDENLLTTLQFYSVLIFAAYFCTSYGTVAYLTSNALLLTLRKGICKHTPLALLQFTAVATKDDNAASCYRVAKDAMSMLERFDVGADVCEIYFQYHARVAWRFEPLQVGISYFRQGFELGLSYGNNDLGIHCTWQAVKNALFSGANLWSILKDIDYYLHILETHKSEATKNYLLIIRETTSLLIDNGEATSIDAKANIGDLDDPKNKIRDAFIRHSAIRCFWQGHTDRCQYYSDKCASLDGQANAPTAVMAKFYHGMNSLVTLKNKRHIRRCKAEVSGSIATLVELAASSDWNFTNKLRLLEAERQSLSQNHKTSLALYEASITSAKKSGFIHEQGLACEKAAFYCREHKREEEAFKYFEQARECYEAWGSTMKVNSLQKELDKSFLAPDS